ncbi:hypothetical protein OLX02_15190 [Novosphingobium sp. KCTC 2891]|uniref:hypothetical protein n=1 Tax=Novosphingobium sp. KCTC 2891 TaxID=2989730 RepID=UPI0022218A95|nr:hypothetical protein [Novosphingobium sp. KCTC 2891]MCW1384167.1 hypothetical protein [Novosphingobium sp. KCTC 2891]
MTRRLTISAGLLALMGAVPALAQTAVAPKDVTATDVVTKPLADINLKKDEIPPLLIAARDHPYDVSALRKCGQIQEEVRQLDAVLGDDIDVVQEKSLSEKRGNSVGNLAKSIVGSLIPFGGVIREISGANENQRQWNLAIYAGSVRRAYLKGLGQQKGCRYPARAASASDVALIQAARAKEVAAKEAEKAKDKTASAQTPPSRRRR